MKENLGSILASEVKNLTKFKDQGEVLESLELKKSRFYDITNPNRLSSSGQPFEFPARIAVDMATKHGRYALVKKIGLMSGCIVITPEEVDGLRENIDGHIRTITLFNTLVGIAKP